MTGVLLRVMMTRESLSAPNLSAPLVNSNTHHLVMIGLDVSVTRGRQVE